MKISKKISWIYYDDKVYLKNIYKNKMICLSDFGKDIWDDLRLGNSVESILAKYINKYQDTSPDEIKKDILDFIAILITKEYLVES